MRVSAIVKRMAAHTLLEGAETSGATGAESFAPDDEDAGTAWVPAARRSLPLDSQGRSSGLRQSQPRWLAIHFWHSG